MDNICVVPLEEIRFTVNPFDYSAKITHDDILSIEAIHNEEYLTWFKVLDESIKTECKTNNIMGIQLPPRTIFQILTDFSKGTVSKEFEIKFPDGFKTSPTSSSSYSQLMIEIHMKISYGFSNIIPIYLDAKELEYKIIVEKKILNLNNKITSLHESLESKKFDASTKECNPPIDSKLLMERIKLFSKETTKNQFEELSSKIGNLTKIVLDQQAIINDLKKLSNESALKLKCLTEDMGETEEISVIYEQEANETYEADEADEDDEDEEIETCPKE